MSSKSTHESLGAAIDACYSASVEAWLHAYGKRNGRKDGFAAEVAAVEMTANTYSGGYTSLAIGIKARRRFNDETYVFRINRRSPREFVLVASNLT